MKKALDYAIAYLLWIVDIVIAILLFFVSRNCLLALMALFLAKGGWIYSQRMNVADRAFVILAGFAWLIFMIFVEQYFRNGVAKEELPIRFYKVSGPLILVLFVVELILFWLQGPGSLLRWLELAVELVAGIGFLVLANTRLTSQST